MSDQPRSQVSTWRIIVAFFLDLVLAFVVSGLLVATLFGGMTANGFALDGWRALLSFALIIGYFVIGRALGGTLWARFFGAVRDR